MPGDGSSRRELAPGSMHPFQHVLAGVYPPMVCQTGIKQTIMPSACTTLGMESYGNKPLEADTDGLDLGVVLQHLVAHLTPPAGLFVSAKGQGRVEDVVAIDPHRSSA